MKIKKGVTAVLAVIACICLIVTAMLFSYVKFNSFNLPRIIYAVTAISIGSEDCVVIQENQKRVIIADPNDPDVFNKYLEANGYAELEAEQMGSMHTIEKNGEKEVVELSVNGYYRLWIWQE